MCYGMLRATARVDESDHHALMYVRHGQSVREHGVDEPLTFEVSALLPVSLGPTGDCSCRD